MPPQLLLPLQDFDLDRVIFGPDEIEAINPQRGAMRHIDAVCWINIEPDRLSGIGYKDVRDDEFWVPGHIPGRPILPGVIMIEAAAQLAALLIKKAYDEPGFLGFMGCDKVRFRGQVVPGDRLYILGHSIEYRPGRRFICSTQGVVDDRLVFEAEIRGTPV